MPDSKLIHSRKANGEAPPRKAQEPPRTSVIAHAFKRTIDCCRRSGDESDPATRVGDGYHVPAR